MEKVTGVDLLASAQTELIEAVTWYNKESEGLGFDFAAEVARTIEKIVNYPLAWAKLSERTRRCRTNRFPYGVIYQIRGNRILIVSIMHMKREPDSWRTFLPPKLQ